MFGRFFDIHEVDDFAGLVVVDVKTLLAPASSIDESARTAQRLEQITERIRRRAASLVGTSTLNFFQKAKLGVLLEEKLEAAGYPTPFNKQLSAEVVEIVALAATQRR
jgi:hypothetical protein